MPLGSPKKRVLKKKAFVFISKTKRVRCNGSRFEDFADSINDSFILYFVRVLKEALHFVKQYQHDALLLEE